MIRGSFGLSEKEIDDILKKEGIEEGNINTAEVTRKAVVSVIKANNEKIANYLQGDFVDFINEELARKMQQAARGRGMSF